MLFCTLDRFQRRKMEILIGCRDKEKAAKYFKNITKNMFFFYQKESNKEWESYRKWTSVRGWMASYEVEHIGVGPLIFCLRNASIDRYFRKKERHLVAS